MPKSKLGKATPTNIRLKHLKPPLQEEASRLDKSLNWLVCKVLHEYVKTLKK
jgi:predicted HicB family RNase H-like nuclease